MEIKIYGYRARTMGENTKECVCKATNFEETDKKKIVIIIKHN